MFLGKGKIELREVPRPKVGPGEALVKVSLTTICGTDVHILNAEYPVKPGLDRRPRAGRRDRGSRGRRDGFRSRGSRGRRRDHALRPVPCVPLERRRPVQPRVGGGRGDRRMAIRQHHQRLPGRIRPGPVRAGEPGAHSAGSDRRGCAHVPGHHVDRHLCRREGQRAHRRRGRRLRSGADRALRDGRRASLRRLARDRRGGSTRTTRGRAKNGRGRRTGSRPSRRRGGDQAADRRRGGRRHRGAGPAVDVRTLPAAASVRAERSRASASTRPTSRCRSTRLRPVSAITRS